MVKFHGRMEHDKSFNRRRRTLSCFVDFVAEIFSPLLAGMPLFLPPDGAAADPLLLVPSLAEARVTRITVTPSLLASLLRTAGSAADPVLPDLHVRSRMKKKRPSVLPSPCIRRTPLCSVSLHTGGLRLDVREKQTFTNHEAIVCAENHFFRGAPLLTSDPMPVYQTWLVSGEALHPDLALLFRRRTAPRTQLINLYGSTEVRNTTFCAHVRSEVFVHHTCNITILAITSLSSLSHVVPKW